MTTFLIGKALFVLFSFYVDNSLRRQRRSCPIIQRALSCGDAEFPPEDIGCTRGGALITGVNVVT
jgi:hypothetical protein